MDRSGVGCRVARGNGPGGSFFFISYPFLLRPFCYLDFILLFIWIPLHFIYLWKVNPFAITVKGTTSRYTDF